MKNSTSDALIPLAVAIAFFGGLALAVWVGHLHHPAWWEIYLGILGGIAACVSFIGTIVFFID